MSVLIRGMEMPKDHPLWIVVHPDGTVEANEVRPPRPVVWQTPLNAAVPVHPHGRLIDADALMKMCGMATDCYDCPNGEHGWCKRSQDAANICEAIENAPTVIPAEGET